MAKATVRKWLFSATVALLLTSTIGIILAFVVRDLLTAVVPSVEFEPMAFDSTLWKASKPEFSWKSPRLRMVDDLLKQHSLIGLTRDEITTLIGEHDDTKYFRQYDMVYFLGQERHPFGIDSEWLVLKLDDQCIACQVEVVRD